MDKQTKQYIDSMKAWMKSQRVSIASCNMAINHARQDIALAEKAIKANEEEKLMKINQLLEAELEIKKYVKHHPEKSK